MSKGLPGIRFAAVAASLFLCASLAPAPAAAQQWTGGGANDDWSTGANWSGGVAPASSATTQLAFPALAPRKSPFVDVPWTVNQLGFQSGGYTISGQTITFAGAAANVTSTGGAANVLSNPVFLSVPTAITGSANFVTLGGPISGPGSLTIGGNGGTVLSGTSTFTGGVNVSGGGVLAFAGSMPGPVTVDIGGIFSGSGTIAGPVTVSGLNAALNSSAPLSTGNLTLGAGSVVNEAINGAGPGQAGTVSVTGIVNISGATLNLSGTHVPAPGNVFTIIANDGTDPVVGTFAGLPEGASVSFNGVALRVSYVGGTGNDVTLTALAPSVPVQVPTLSEWALMLLACVVLVTGLLRLRRGR